MVTLNQGSAPYHYTCLVHGIMVDVRRHPMSFHWKAETRLFGNIQLAECSSLDGLSRALDTWTLRQLTSRLHHEP